MEGHFKKKLIITKTEVPFIRAGSGNLILLVIAIWIMFGIDVVENSNLPIFANTILFLPVLFFIYGYFTSVSKIFFFTNMLEIVATVRTKRFVLQEIERIKLFAMPLNSSISINIKLKGKFLPTYFSFVVMSKTNFGKYKNTLNALEKLFIEYQIPYKKTIGLIGIFKNVLKKSNRVWS